MSRLATASAPYAYAQATVRNAGFLSQAEQARLAGSSVLVLGAGGMGGVALQTLARAGVGRLVLADMDTFEVSNLNRQLFATMETVGREKTEVTREALLTINPELTVETLGSEWVEQLDELLPRHPVVINAMDDLAAGLILYRKARLHGATVIDAWTSPCPNVFVVRPSDPRPEELLASPTVGVSTEDLTAGLLSEGFLREVAYVLTHSAGIHHMDAGVVKEILAGTRDRSSFAPVVSISGNLMAFEAMAALLGRDSAAGFRGYFLNPWTGAVERPGRGPLAWIRHALIRGRVLREAGGAA